jgi:hypothetical protein
MAATSDVVTAWLLSPRPIVASDEDDGGGAGSW